MYINKLPNAIRVIWLLSNLLLSLYKIDIMTLDKIRKFLLTGTLGTRDYSIPRFELFLIPLVFLVLAVLTIIWDKEISKYLDKNN